MMKHYNDYAVSFFERYNYPEEAVTKFSEVLRRMDDEPAFGERIDAIAAEYFSLSGDMGRCLEKVKKASEDFGENEFTLNFIFLLSCTPTVLELYKVRHIDESIFWDTMDDLRCKLIECIKCEEVPGIFVPGWYDGFFRVERFAIGRFQFEICNFRREEDFVMHCGKVVKHNDLYVNFHIPSSGIPLTDEVRYDAYRRAYKLFKNLFSDGNVLFGCGSWLLYPRHKEFFPANLNILKFLGDFEIVDWSESDHFGNGWRVFDKYSDLPYNELPRDTSLRRAYADWLTAGNKAGDGFGLFLFDGEKIVK